MRLKGDLAGFQYLVVKNDGDDRRGGTAVGERAIVPAAALPQARPVQAPGQRGHENRSA